MRVRASSTGLGNAQLTLSLASRGVRSSAVRLPPTVHGEGEGGFLDLVTIARAKGLSAYIGDGSNRWPAVPRLDAAPFPASAGERSAGVALHAVAREGAPIREVAELIGRHLDVPVACISPEDAGRTSSGWPASSPSTAQPRARGPANCWGGSPPTPGSSTTSTKATTSTRPSNHQRRRRPCLVRK